MKNKAGMATPRNSDWETPDSLFNSLNKRFRFNVDLAASTENRKVDTFFSIENCALKQNWYKFDGWLWCNPPYDRHVQDKFVQKAYEEAKKGGSIVMLLPARVDTARYHLYVKKYFHKFIKGRLKFKGATENAPYPCMLVFFDKYFEI